MFLPGESHGQRRLVGCGLWGCKDLDRTEQLTHTQTHPGFSSTDGLIFSFFILLFSSEKKMKIVNVISESQFSEFWSCSKDSKMCSKHDKIWLFKSTFLEHHETYLTLTRKKQFRKKNLLYSPQEGDNFFPLPFKLFYYFYV